MRPRLGPGRGEIGGGEHESDGEEIDSTAGGLDLAAICVNQPAAPRFQVGRVRCELLRARAYGSPYSPLLRISANGVPHPVLGAQRRPSAALPAGGVEMQGRGCGRPGRREDLRCRGLDAADLASGRRCVEQRSAGSTDRQGWEDRSPRDSNLAFLAKLIGLWVWMWPSTAASRSRLASWAAGTRTAN